MVGEQSNLEAPTLLFPARLPTTRRKPRSESLRSSARRASWILGASSNKPITCVSLARVTPSFGIATFRDVPPGVCYEVHYPGQEDGNFLRVVLIKGKTRVTRLMVTRD